MLIVLVPCLVMQIVLGVGVCLCPYCFRSVLDLQRRDSRPDAWLKNLVGRYDSPCRYDGPVRHHRVVHHDGPHADDHVISDHAPVHIGPMPYRNIISDYAFRLLICGMQHCVVLNIHPVSDTDCSHIPAKHCSVPYAAVVPDAHRSDQHGSLRQKRPLPDNRPVALEVLYYCHEIRPDKLCQTLQI